MQRSVAAGISVYCRKSRPLEPTFVVRVLVSCADVGAVIRVNAQQTRLAANKERLEIERKTALSVVFLFPIPTSDAIAKVTSPVLLSKGVYYQ